MRTLTIWILLLTMFTTSGCTVKSSVCPIFPKPNEEVVIELQKLNNEEVDRWVVELYKLQMKLGQ